MVRGSIVWRQGLVFDASASFGTLTLASGEEQLAGSFGPKELVALGLAGCTGMDVASILEKMRGQLRGLRVQVEAESAPEHPKYLKSITIDYQVQGDYEPDQVRRAVALSLDKYCGVAATLAAKASITPRVSLNGTSLS